jgi:hypothetical protein
MSIIVTIPTKVVTYTKNQLENWKDGNREDCPDMYLKSLSGTKGFGEFIVGQHFSSLGYQWLHRFSVFGGNKVGTFPKGDEVLLNYLGKDLLEKSLVIYPNFKHLPFESPDLMIYKPDFSEVRFVEVKRLDTRDKIREAQIRGLALISLLLKCQVEIFEGVRREKITFPKLSLGILTFNSSLAS